MDLNESPSSESMSDSRPISPSPVTETVIAAPATVEKAVIAAPATVEETFIVAPVKVEENVIAAPANVEETVIAAQVKVEENVISAPATVEEAVIAAPATVKEAVIAAAAMKKEAVIAAPATVREAVIAAPETVEEEINGAKRKRGRPRKYDREVIKQSGRPKKSLRNITGDITDMSMNLEGRDFTPHIFTVNRDEDIIKSIMSFTENGLRGISVLSANGAVYSFKLQPLAPNSNVLWLRDAYEIISLSNSMVITESGRVKNENWRITIGGAEGRVFSGYVAGRLTAASPVQVVIGSYWPLITNQPLECKDEPEDVVFTSTGQVQQPEMITSLTL